MFTYTRHVFIGFCVFTYMYMYECYSRKDTVHHCYKRARYIILTAACAYYAFVPHIHDIASPRAAALDDLSSLLK